MKYIAIGDVHGMKDKLVALLGQLEPFIKDGARLIFLGDLIDRGPDSRDVVKIAQDFQKKGHIVLTGNHEDMATLPKGNLWFNNGGRETLASYHGHDDLDADKAWFKTLPTHYETDVHFFCHAGIQPGKPLHKQTRDELIWIREEFLYTNRIHPKYIVHGHSSVQYVCGMHVSDPEILENRCNLDTGACFWNKSARLTAALFEDGVKKPIQVFQV